MMHKLISFKSSHLIFELFIEDRLNEFYASKVINIQSNTSFNLSHVISNHFKRILIIKDVPSYLNFKLQQPEGLHYKTIKQYNGYLLNLKDYQNSNAFILDNLNKRNRKNLNSKKERLFKNHNITSQFYYGAIDRDDYNSIFKIFYSLLKKRFIEKKMLNRYLTNWDDLQKSTYHKILSKKASLHVIYDELNPILITLNFHKGDVVFSHIQTYDVNYSKYNLGDISMINHIDWLINNNFTLFDLSMGKTYYKEKWSNYKYIFYYHIFYKRKSLLSKILVNIIALELKFIQFLRDKNIVGNFINFDKLLYKFKRKSAK
ncbi:GNAT family N-acetyltransferase [Sabulilitoribacter multivorans]|uniref:GNAT family N-acetyltransferase n=1 Tax=Flaviramulus multivorans TaxID=1304750 RepID=A0ABS9IJN8_9FLAO|nr:GNAT family N-acetyltransferase [Flaviramulus multivorans]MCF7560792.1 GNAT family N-acetyltransferase [Flaviramulus multivorans]